MSPSPVPLPRSSGAPESVISTPSAVPLAGALAGEEPRRSGWERLKHAWATGGMRGVMALLARGPDRKLRLTTPGRLFFTLMAVIVGIGYITGNNLLFLLFAAMLSLMVASGVLSEWAVGDVRARRLLPDRVFAGVPASWGFELINRSATGHTFALEVVERDATMVGDLPYVVALPPQGSAKATGAIRFDRRGVARLSGVEIRTEFPFLLFSKVKTVDLPGAVLVMPPPAAEVEVAVNAAREARESEAARSGEGDEVAYVREAVEGESPRLIHWKKTARIGRFVAKSFQAESSPSVLLTMDEEKGGNIEPGLATLARLAVDLDAENMSTALRLGNRFIAEGRGAAHVTEMLTALAVYGDPEAEREFGVPPPGGAGGPGGPSDAAFGSGGDFPPQRTLRVEASNGRVHLPTT